MKLYIDASTQVTTGISGVGIHFVGENQASYAIPLLEHYTNHEAEFIALIIALRLYHESNQPSPLLIFTDSQTLADAVTHHRVQNKHLKELLYIVQQRLKNIKEWHMTWIPEKKNQAADRLARKACQLAEKEKVHDPLNKDGF